MRVGTVTFGQIAVLLIVLSLGLHTPSEAGVFWTEDFENHLTPNWNTMACGSSLQDGCNAVISTDRATNGTHSLKSHYPDINVQAGTYYDRAIPNTDEVWMRFYYYTVNFTYYVPAMTKLFFNLGLGAEIYWGNAPNSSEMYAAVTTVNNVTCPNGSIDRTCNYYPNVGSVPLANNQWYCFETHVIAGTNGNADGVLELFVNGRQTLSYTNARLNTNGGPQFNTVRHYTQMGQGDRYIDDLVVGNTRIGCGVTASSDITPPAAPVGLTIK